MKLKIEREIFPQCLDEVTSVDGTFMKNYFDKYKFAELIVQECIKIVKPSQDHEAYPENFIGGIDGLELLEGKVADIKRYFGVEEC